MLFTSHYPKTLRRSMTMAFAIMLALHLSAASTCARQPKKKPLTTPTTVLITATDTHGTIIGYGCGFFADTNGSIITASRIVKDAQTVYIKTHDGKRRKARGIIASHKELTRLKTEKSPRVQHTEFSGSSLTPPGAMVTVCGLHETGKVIKIICKVTGYQKTAGGYILQIEPPLTTGLNGSPVINNKGEVVGAAVNIMASRQRVTLVHPCEPLLQQPILNPSRHIQEQKKSLSSDADKFFISGDYARALPFFQRAVQQRPASAEDHFKIGYCLSELNRHAEAIDSYHAALKLDKTLGKAWNNLGLSFAASGKHHDAIAAYQHAISISSQDYAAYNNLGITYIHLGMNGEACNALIKAVKLKPDSAEAHNNLGIAYFRLGDKGSALGQYAVLKQLDKKKAEKFFTLLYQTEP